MLPVVIVGVALEIALRSMPNDYKYKKQYIESHAGDIEVLVLGSSHTYYGVNPEYFSKQGFNASYVSQSLFYDFEILKEQIEKMPGLQTVILPVSVFSLYTTLEDMPDSWRIKNYVLYYGLDNTGDLSNYAEITANQLEVSYKKFQDYYLKHRPVLTCSELGWGTEFKWENSRDLEVTGKESAERHTQKEDNHVNENTATLKAIADLCEARGIKLVLFTPPAHKAYYENLDNKQLNTTIEVAESIAAMYGNATYNNMLKSTLFNKEDFFDGDHLNDKGAQKLSLLLDEMYISENK